MSNTSQTVERPPALKALDRIMSRMSTSHVQHAEDDRVTVEAAIVGSPTVDASSPRVTESLKAEVDRLIEVINDLRNGITNRDTAIAERDSAIVELRTGRDNALTLADTLTTKFGAKIKLIRDCVESSVLESDAVRLQAVRTALDS